jgi:phage terminase small subunit
MANNLTTKQEAFIANVLRGKNGTRAAMGAYDTTDENTAAVIAYENLRKPKIITEINNTLYGHNLVQRSIEVLAKGLEATKYTPSINDYVPDHKVRLKAATMGINLLFKVNGQKQPL